MSAPVGVGGMLDCGDTGRVWLCTLGNLWAHPKIAASEEVVREVGGAGVGVQFVGPALHRLHTQKPPSPPAADKSPGPYPLHVSQPSRASHGFMRHPRGLQRPPTARQRREKLSVGMEPTRSQGAVGTGAKPVPTRIRFWCKAIPTRNPREAAPRDTAEAAADAGTYQHGKG